ncbi:MAG: shikimate dehydrogenase [Desulfobacterales bacterium]|nr:shikimate dehydrogenase [Desulfobacterales bacterium]
MTIDQHTSLYGVVGKPIGHSLGPAMHNAAFLEAGLDAVYLAFETEDMEGCLRGIRALGIKGISVTIPFKSRVIPYLDDVDPLAKKIGAVNTIINDDGRLAGYNTDALGAYRALNEKGVLPGKSCLVLGAGGAARAIGFTLKENGVDISVVNRSDARGNELARVLECPYIPLDRLGEHKADLLIQTTPVGMSPNIEECLVRKPVLREGMVVMDIIYNPLETRLLKMAKALGCVTISGLSMFVYQGSEQFRLWTGINPPVGTMRRAAETALLEQNESN